MEKYRTYIQDLTISCGLLYLIYSYCDIFTFDDNTICKYGNNYNTSNNLKFIATKISSANVTGAFGISITLRFAEKIFTYNTYYRLTSIILSLCLIGVYVALFKYSIHLTVYELNCALNYKSLTPSYPETLGYPTY